MNYFETQKEIREIIAFWLKENPELEELYFSDYETEYFIQSIATFLYMNNCLELSLPADPPYQCSNN